MPPPQKVEPDHWSQLPQEQCYELFVAHMEKAPKLANAVPFRFALERQLADGFPVIELLVSEMQARNLHADVIESVRRALLWKQQQLQSRMRIIGNLN
jgi:hypothetical protein